MHEYEGSGGVFYAHLEEKVIYVKIVLLRCTNCRHIITIISRANPRGFNHTHFNLRNGLTGHFYLLKYNHNLMVPH
jgi:hypothetical protein